MVVEDVDTWVRCWADLYPEAEDETLEPLRGKTSFTPSEVETVIRWKVKSYRGRSVASMRAEPAERVEDLTRRAFACGDDLGALLILDALGGVGVPVASALLMVQDPDRFTVIDPRALSSLRDALGRLDAHAPTAWHWLDYLEACRQLATDADESLRRVDRALYQAKGRSTLP